jgi:hypothetical protein
MTLLALLLSLDICFTVLNDINCDVEARELEDIVFHSGPTSRFCTPGER